MTTKMTAKLRMLLSLLAVLTLSGLVTVGCGEDDNTSNPTDNTNPDNPKTSDYSLRLATNCDVLLEHIIDTTTEQALQYRYSPMRYLAGGDGGAPTADNSSSSGGAPTDYTTTNVQEEGVDEVDIVKTDGSFIYTVHNNKLVIFKSWPATEVGEVSSINIYENTEYPSSPEYPSHYASGWARGLFLHGDRVAVFSDIYEYSYDAQGNYVATDSFYGTRITVVDVSDRAQPQVISTRDLEGYFNNARMIGGDVYAVTNGYLDTSAHGVDVWSIAWREDLGLPSTDFDWSDEAERTRRIDQARPILRAAIAQSLAGADARAMLPEVRTGADQRAPMLACDDVYIPQTLAQPGVLSISHLDLAADQSAITSTGVLADGWQVYSSQENLYVSMSSGGWWWGWGPQENETHIHKFDLNGDNGLPAYAASGKVDGWLLNQFSMSEFNGFLRVATTDNDWTWNEATQTSTVTGGNHLTILEDANGSLNEVGAVRDLAPGERIYSARMMGNKGYLVTFLQTDPLFTFDLSDPRNPRLLGELKVNGFSSYMHPVGDTHLLTIGQNADDQGRVTGVHLQLFDVSDLSNPTRAFQAEISTGSWSSWSEAMWDHHAFTYHANKEILAFPINIYNWDEATQTQSADNFSGLLVYKASPTTGFQEIGRVAHSDLVTQRWCEQYTGSGDCRDSYYDWWTNMRRSIFIEDYLYSLSDIGLKVNELLNPSNELVAIPFE